MYLDDIAEEIRRQVPAGKLPRQDADDLLRLYAVLLRVKGQAVLPSDVHDAWSAWMTRSNSTHEALVEYSALDTETRREDDLYVEAIQRAALQIKNKRPSEDRFLDVLFPNGLPKNEKDFTQALELYKIIVESSENLINRRQTANSFFLTLNGVLITVVGFILQNSNGQMAKALWMIILGIVGAILCGAWRSLIISFGKLNTGKFKVINTIERYLKIAIYTAEWDALGFGEKKYRSFTSKEIWVPTTLTVGYIIVVIVAAALLLFSL
ncbi:MAG: hypothetical protein KIT07_02095 [Anaerolineales bacterium]|nr:hypothetical protein [Anaerolineales bacterium]